MENKNLKIEQDVLKKLFLRYNRIIVDNKQVLTGLPERCNYENLLSLTEEAIKNIESYPTDKMHRWMGFVQGILSVKGLISVDEERNYTRPLLHSYHEDKPKSFGD